MLYRRTKTECIHCLEQVPCWIDEKGDVYLINHNCIGQKEAARLKKIKNSRGSKR